jgi:glycosyltransferase involved in cell wall biosynthesis
MKISVVMPCYNEKNYISECLDSVIANDYPKDGLELLVYDGGSSDGSLKILDSFSKRHPFIKVRNNPKRIQAAAMNLGIKEASGDIIIRMDAHTIYAVDYISRIVKLLAGSEAVNVGGGQEGKGNSYFTNAISLAMVNPFIAGNASYRIEKEKDVYVDTVYLGAWRKEDLVKSGGFDESFVINEDYELNYRLRASGGKILFSPGIKSEYYVRGSPVKMARQYFRYGFWKARTIKKHPGSLVFRQLAAPVFVLGLAACAALYSAGYGYFLYALLSIYLLSFLALSVQLFSAEKFKYIPAVFASALIIHVSWGIGFWTGLLYWYSKRTEQM